MKVALADRRSSSTFYRVITGDEEGRRQREGTFYLRTNALFFSSSVTAREKFFLTKYSAYKTLFHVDIPQRL